MKKFFLLITICTFTLAFTTITIAHAKTLFINDNNAKTITLAQVETALKHGARVNIQDYNHMTPLMYASESNPDPQVIEKLFEYGADVNIIGYAHTTALMLAVTNNPNPKITEVLLKHKAKVDDTFKHRHGMTPLMQALKNHSNPEIIKLLLDYGANVNFTEIDGITPLMIALDNGADLPMIKLLLKHGASMQTSRYTKKTPLLFASKYPTSMAKFLLDHGGNKNSKKLKSLALFNAVTNNKYPKTVELLLNHGANVNYEDKDGITPLFQALCYNNNPNYSIIKLLLSHGANPNLNRKDRPDYHSNNTSLMCASMNITDETIIESLLKNGANPIYTPQYTSQYYHKPASTSDNKYIMPLLLASQYNSNPKVIATFLKYGANVNGAYDFYGHDETFTPLMISSRLNPNPKVTEFLLNHGGDATFKNNLGKTPLMEALKTSHQNPRIIELLINHGSDVMARDTHDRSTLDYAFFINNHPTPKALELLFTHGKTPTNYMIQQANDYKYNSNIRNLIKKYTPKGQEPKMNRHQKNQHMFKFLVHILSYIH